MICHFMDNLSKFQSNIRQVSLSSPSFDQQDQNNVSKLEQRVYTKIVIPKKSELQNSSLDSVHEGQSQSLSSHIQEKFDQLFDQVKTQDRDVNTDHLLSDLDEDFLSDQHNNSLFQGIDENYQIGYNDKSQEHQVLLQKISHMNQLEQLRYIEDKIKYYERVKELFLQKYPHIEQQSKPNNSRINQKIGALRLRLPKAKKKKFIPSPQQLKDLSLKLQILNAAQKGGYKTGYIISLSTIASQLNIPQSSIYRLYNEWLRDPGFQKKILKMLARSNKCQEQGQNSNQEYPKSVIYRMNGLNGKNKKTNYSNNEFNRYALHADINSEKAINIRYAYCEYFRKIRNQHNIYFLDQYHSKILSQNNSSGSHNYSLMTILSLSGQAFWKIVKFDGTKYSNFQDISKLLQTALQQQKSSKKNYLVLDFSIARDESKQNQIKKILHGKILLLPVYSQQLNPLNFWFRQVSMSIQEQRKSSLQTLNRVLNKFSNKNFSNYIREMDRYIEKGLTKQPF